MECSSGGLPLRKGEIYGNNVRTVLTEVINDSNIQYLNSDDDDDPGSQLYVTQVCLFSIKTTLINVPS